MKSIIQTINEAKTKLDLETVKATKKNFGSMDKAYTDFFDAAVKMLGGNENNVLYTNSEYSMEAGDVLDNMWNSDKKPRPEKTIDFPEGGKFGLHKNIALGQDTDGTIHYMKRK